MRLLEIAVCLLPVTLAASNAERHASGPTVTTSNGKVVGSSVLGIDTFNGIPFAQPPIGQLRLKPPQPITSHLGTVQATGVPRACPQYAQVGAQPANLSFLPPESLAPLAGISNPITEFGEDCLTLNVQRPSTATAKSALPVVFWIFGGAFLVGSTQAPNATELITTSIAQGKEVIYVAVNYRIGGFGFLPGKEILADGAANIALLDQRLGLKWVADNIAAFGGDPRKVTIWGESSGSISVFDQMALYDGHNTYKGKALFRAAVMDSGSIIPSQPVDDPTAQALYDAVVQNAGCSGSYDTLDCLRKVNYTTFSNAINSVAPKSGSGSLDVSYSPRPDGTILTKSSEILAEKGLFAKVPFIIGDQEDEGTIFVLSLSNVTTTSELEKYLNTAYYPDATASQIAALVATYPDEASAGSPFGTGDLYNIYPQYKRLAAIIGDVFFTLARRYFLNVSSKVHPSVPSWSYLAAYDKNLPYIGTFHGSDVLAAYGLTTGFPSVSTQSYYLSFFNTMDPNSGNEHLTHWPQWCHGKELLSLNALNNTVERDNFRESSYDVIANFIGSLHL
ncbi:MAG: 37S ribosomal protein S22 [Chaenotheca gracillima]|nr:MAG: 37S ribosomal protein S22 [Chaenotheca gracillima]